MEIDFLPAYFKTRNFLFLLFLVFSTSVFAQENKVVSDLNLWTEIKLEKKIVKNLHFSVSQQLRFFRNISELDDYIAEAGLDYTINKNFSIGANGRYTLNKHYNESAKNDYRYDFHLNFDGKLRERIKIYYRLKFQKDYYDSAVFDPFLNYFETTFRNRIKAGWKLNDAHQIYTSAEIFRLTKKSREPFFDKYRIFLGDEVSSRFGDFDFAFGLEKQLNNENPYTYFILKTAFTIKL